MRMKSLNDDFLHYFRTPNVLSFNRVVEGIGVGRSNSILRVGDTFLG